MAPKSRNEEGCPAFADNDIEEMDTLYSNLANRSPALDVIARTDNNITSCAHRRLCRFRQTRRICDWQISFPLHHCVVGKSTVCHHGPCATSPTIPTHCQYCTVYAGVEHKFMRRCLVRPLSSRIRKLVGRTVCGEDVSIDQCFYWLARTLPYSKAVAVTPHSN